MPAPRTGWFFLDFFSSIPIDQIIKLASDDTESGGVAESNARTTKLLKILRLIRLAKLLRLLRASRIFRYVRYMRVFLEEQLHITIPIWTYKIASLIATIVLIGHWVGSIQFMVVKQVYQWTPYILMPYIVTALYGYGPV